MNLTQRIWRLTPNLVHSFPAATLSKMKREGPLEKIAKLIGRTFKIKASKWYQWREVKIVLYFLGRSSFLWFFQWELSQTDDRDSSLEIRIWITCRCFAGSHKKSLSLTGLTTDCWPLQEPTSKRTQSLSCLLCFLEELLQYRFGWRASHISQGLDFVYARFPGDWFCKLEGKTPSPSWLRLWSTSRARLSAHYFTTNTSAHLLSEFNQGFFTYN